MCYLPTTLVVLALMIRLHDRTDRQLRIQAGLAGYIAALVAVPVVGAMPDSSQMPAMAAHMRHELNPGWLLSLELGAHTVCHCTVCCLMLSTGAVISGSCWE